MLHRGQQTDACDTLFLMSRLAKAVLILLLAALPLRGYAGALMASCETHHGGAAAAQAHAHEHGDGHHADSGDGGGTPAHTASVCGICASCCSGASLAPDANALVAFPAPGIDRTLFFDRRASGFVPESLDRPPLSS